MYEAKTKLSRLVERALAGEEIVIAKAGKPMVKLVPVDRPAKRMLGSAAGTVQYAEGWNSPMSDAEFEELLRG